MTFTTSKYEAIDDVASKLQKESVYHLNLSPERTNLNSTHDDYELNTNEDTEHTDLELARAKRITGLDAISALVKGNLGPGCLNLPYAFALTGWVVGSFFFLIVAVQGIYSMWLLTYCKQLLLANGKRGDTYMDVAKLSIGKFGQRGVQFFLFVQQAGVCCVFMSLISTNLKGGLKSWGYLQISNSLCTGVVTLVLLFIVTLRFIKDLRWLSAIANAFMILAIFTAAFAGINEISMNADELLPPKAYTSSIADVATFISSMFFAFEGIGLVMPIENSYCAGYRNPHDLKLACKTFRIWLVLAMTIVAVLFVIIGLSASIGFPDIAVGSVSDYLIGRYPSDKWYQTINVLIIIAVLFTFPLQLTPAVEVLDEWCGSNANSHIEKNDIEIIENPDDTNILPSAVSSNQDETFDDGDQNELLTSSSSFCAKYDWLLRRWLLVLGCALMVSIVSDLSDLISLFGAFGQTGLAAMPCFIHYNLQHAGIAPSNIVRYIIDRMVIAFCGMVMIAGFIFSLQNIMTSG